MSGILVTGANGFVGRALCETLVRHGHDVTALVRRGTLGMAGVREWRHDAPDFAGLLEAWPDDLTPDCVVHLAARVHVMRDESPDPGKAFHATNVEGTLRVARAAHARGVRRLVFASSIKAVGETDGGTPLAESAAPGWLDPYGRSKREAEDALWALGAQTSLEIVVVRPPLVYGPGVRANFLQMMSALWRGMPLPLGAIDARRSMVYAENLADALMRCATDARAANACFHVADTDDLSVSQLLRVLADDLAKPARLIPVPPGLLSVAGRLTGRSAQIQRLTSDLRLDTSLIREKLDWQPPFTAKEGLAKTARWYRETQATRHSHT
ncbi:UDP-glucose 4-epimerase family protein [Paraburkholderia acidisoli]|uniref:NAD-dependent epimerase/dehydratase family protein n=1 Tax=Paraburkholderia acidisoli TaxID=2571748 RepID=A0A7Z2JF58_9BURK|nr:SDR family oxidoreductase [Paraburkholderia acidisoli]QGZ60800.1 NAD-dependent epimerase/dehydratase family protein [Paraburkholderia acidisoli]